MRHHKKIDTLCRLRYFRKPMLPRRAFALCLVSFSLIVLITSGQTERPPRRFELRAESPHFWDLLDKDATLESVATGFGFTEGPVWDPAGFVYVSDEEQNKIYRVYADGHRDELIALGDPDGMMWRLIGPGGPQDYWREAKFDELGKNSSAAAFTFQWQSGGTAFNQVLPTSAAGSVAIINPKPNWSS